jgi:hypothetical protein
LPTTFNGCGTRYFPAGRKDQDGFSKHVLFFVLFYMPVFPLQGRLLGKSASSQHWGGPTLNTSKSYEDRGKTKLSLSDILFVYFVYWFFFPLAFVLPVFLVVVLLDHLGVPISGSTVNTATIITLVITFIGGLIGAILLYRWLLKGDYKG